MPDVSESSTDELLDADLIGPALAADYIAMCQHIRDAGKNGLTFWPTWDEYGTIWELYRKMKIIAGKS